ncbi:reverse transcriptase domain-containing protein [Candidatus Entotheonella palauensis]|nr:reverse transcriptase domain-containing protein [Candidatus Entotheonella palauensis]
MTKKEIWFEAYRHIAPNKGATTAGPDEVTQDRFSEGRVENLIETLKSNRYSPKPVRRTYIPKANGKLRPLGIPAGDEKLVQEVVRIILESIYEPIFSDDSHGFRPSMSCHTALKHVKTWTNTVWFIEFDIKGYFDSISHKKLVDILEKRIDDRKFVRLIKDMLRAGVLENWQYNRTYSGTPQGGVVSPLLANIYLHELDDYIKAIQVEVNKGKTRQMNPDWTKIANQIARKRRQIRRIREERGKGTPEESEWKKAIDALMKQRQAIPSHNPYDPNYRRLWYCRYADDWLLGFTGPKTEAHEIEKRIRQYVETELLLTVSEEKTGIRKAQDSIRFLGYGIRTQRGEKVKRAVIRGTATKRKTINGQIKLFVPEEKVIAFCKSKGYGELKTRGMKARPFLTNQSEVETILRYNAEMRGFANYYSLAQDVKHKLDMLSYIATYSCLATLAAKHKTGIAKMAKQMGHQREFEWKVTTPKGKVKTYRIWQIKHLKPVEMGQEIDSRPNPYAYNSRTELLKRLTAEKCEYCGREGGYLEVHHVRKLKDLKEKRTLEPWERIMIQRQRKTLILCVFCHDLLHAGRLPDMRLELRPGSKGPSRK